MRCPYCGHEEQKVLDSRPAREGDAIRRRRECLSCERRFTTFEEPERPRLFVVKRGGERQEFSREKVLNSILLACHKRAVPVDVLREAAEEIERDLIQHFEEEVPTRFIGDLVLAKLEKIDTVAFVRFASVYQEFQTVGDFLKIIESVHPATPTQA
jgi:transcriptional repressor NrdR